MSIISAILAALRALPILDKWFEGLVVAWTNSRIESMREENILAIREVIEKHDQRKLESALGSPTSGKPSNDAGTSIIDSLPGLRNSPKDSN
jgi:hypothetical protein